MQPSPELRELMLCYYDASASSDADFLDQLIARVPEGLIIGTDDEEWWPDGASAAEIWTSAWRRRGSSPIVDANPQAYAEGDFGWVVDHPAWQQPGKPARSFRLTAIFNRIEGEWKLVHAHFSFGVPNAQE
jgi:hypothetical protein